MADCIYERRKASALRIVGGIALARGASAKMVLDILWRRAGGACPAGSGR